MSAILRVNRPGLLWWLRPQSSLDHVIFSTNLVCAPNEMYFSRNPPSPFPGQGFHNHAR